MVRSALEATRSDLLKLRRHNLHNHFIPEHRSIRVLHFNTARWVDVLAIPSAFLVLLWVAWPLITRGWAQFMTLVLSMIFPDVAFAPYLTWFSNIPIWVPSAEQVGPSRIQWIFGLLFCVICFGMTRLKSSHWTPVRYTAAFLGLLQTSAQLYFFLFPTGLPYNTFTLLGSEIETSSTFIFLTPILLSLSFNIFPFSTTHTVALTTLTLIHLIVLTPIQYAMHFLILSMGSTLWMPLLWFIFGFPISIFSFIALYAWAMSWRSTVDEVLN